MDQVFLQNIATKADAIDLRPEYVLSACFALGSAKNKNPFLSNVEIFEMIAERYALTIANRIEHDNPEITFEELSFEQHKELCNDSPLGKDMLTVASKDETIKQHHVLAVNEAAKYSNNVIENHPDIISKLRNVFRPEIEQIAKQMIEDL